MTNARSVRRILVGVDGSDNGHRALEWAVYLAGELGAEVVVVHAAGLLAHLDPEHPVPSHSHLEELRAALRSEWCGPLEGSGVPHRVLCLEGPAVLTLLSAIEAEDADLVVLGSRGTGGRAELMLGSTSLQVAEQSPRPVLIVPAHRAARSVTASAPAVSN